MLSEEAKKIILTQFTDKEIPKDEVSLIAWVHNVVNPWLIKAGMLTLVEAVNYRGRFIVTNEEFAKGKAEFRIQDGADTL